MPIIEFLPAVIETARKLVLFIHAVVDDPLVLAESLAPFDLALALAVIGVPRRQNRHSPLRVDHRREMVIVKNLSTSPGRRDLIGTAGIDRRHGSLPLPAKEVLVVPVAVAVVGVKVQLLEQEFVVARRSQGR